MVKTANIDEFQYQLLLEAIDIVEANDYVGLLIDRAKIIIQTPIVSVNLADTFTLYTDVFAAINHLNKYRSLNRKLLINAEDDALHLAYDQYFNSRVRSGKLILKKLAALLLIEQEC
ncbi:hypothetical protein [Pedobacter sp. KBS0701]|uniref:hypothetical protein n=1 Tax=unclassified Pedobacter TaxID=2628915 RepID=UPI00110D6F18|nr:hypothetical protein [Pedobacter sp. KBS0701]QDW24859.1 hypothetical protein FFJ24_008555 [Pedobacter sp. KBS0701]